MMIVNRWLRRIVRTETIAQVMMERENSDDSKDCDSILRVIFFSVDEKGYEELIEAESI